MNVKLIKLLSSHYFKPFFSWTSDFPASMLEKVSGNSYCFLRSPGQHEHHLWPPLSRGYSLLPGEPLPIKLLPIFIRIYRWVRNPPTKPQASPALKESPCPSEASSRRAASLPLAATTPDASQPAPVLSRKVGTRRRCGTFGSSCPHWLVCISIILHVALVPAPGNSVSLLLDCGALAPHSSH